MAQGFLGERTNMHERNGIGGSLGGRRAALALLGAMLIGGLVSCASAPVQQEVEIPVYPQPPAPARFVYERTITGSGDIIVETGQDRFRRFATGEVERGKGFAKPFDIVVRHGRIYVSDTVQRKVHMIDLVAHKYQEIGVKGNGRLTKPLGLDLDEQGRLYVCDGTAKRVVIFGPDGEYIGAVGSEEMLERPSGVAVSRDGSKIYVVDTGGVRSQDHRVRVFSPNGDHLGDIGTRGAGAGEFNLPLNANVDEQGILWVLDTGNFRVQSFSPDAKLLNTFGKPGRYAGQFSHAKGIDSDLDGRIYVSDTGFGVVQIFSPDGRVMMSLGNRSESNGPGVLLLPAGVSVDVDGRVYVVDQFFQKVEVFKPVFLPASWPYGQDYHTTPGLGFLDDLGAAN
jgi:sugar lactone lactonase YvrE